MFPRACGNPEYEFGFVNKDILRVNVGIYKRHDVAK